MRHDDVASMSIHHFDTKRTLGGVLFSVTKVFVLFQCDRDVCMRLLLQVKGVISITFDMHKKRCILRTKPDVRPEVC